MVGMVESLFWQMYAVCVSASLHECFSEAGVQARNKKKINPAPFRLVM